MDVKIENSKLVRGDVDIIHMHMRFDNDTNEHEEQGT